MEESVEPFTPTLERLLEERDWSVRYLAHEMQRTSGWGTQQGVWAYMRGHTPPTIAGMEAISTALHIDPRHFAEYRLLRAMHELDWRKVGLTRALATLGGCPGLGR